MAQEEKIIPELKPCPFCGAPGTLERLGGEKSTHTIARCSKCRCDLHFYPTKEAAISAWNTRAAEPALTARTHEMERMRGRANHAEIYAEGCRAALAPQEKGGQG